MDYYTQCHYFTGWNIGFNPKLANKKHIDFDSYVISKNVKLVYGYLVIFLNTSLIVSNPKSLLATFNKLFVNSDDNFTFFLSKIRAA